MKRSSTTSRRACWPTRRWRKRWRRSTCTVTSQGAVTRATIEAAAKHQHITVDEPAIARQENDLLASHVENVRVTAGVTRQAIEVPPGPAGVAIFVAVVAGGMIGNAICWDACTNDPAGSYCRWMC